MKTGLYLLLAVISMSCPVHAYEVATHGRVTYEAYKRTQLVVDPTIIQDLGIPDVSNPFGTTYYDVSGGRIEQRTKRDFEQSAKRMPEEVDPLSIPGWLLRGAIREDDFLWPLDDPYAPLGNFVRVLHHFYDPINDTPLEGYLVVDLCESIPWDLCAGTDSTKTALSWATGAAVPFGGLNTADTTRRNHFTVFDAREAMYRAVTGQDRNGNRNIGPGGVPADESIRKAYWATTFWALGDVLHLLQDLAQPPRAVS